MYARAVRHDRWLVAMQTRKIHAWDRPEPEDSAEGLEKESSIIFSDDFPHYWLSAPALLSRWPRLPDFPKGSFHVFVKPVEVQLEFLFHESPVKTVGTGDILNLNFPERPGAEIKNKLPTASKAKSAWRIFSEGAPCVVNDFVCMHRAYFRILYRQQVLLACTSCRPACLCSAARRAPSTPALDPVH